MSTNNLIFPEGVTYTQGYITGGDFAPTNGAFTTIGNLYKYASNVVIDLKFDTSNVTNTSQMFSGCTSLVTVPLFDTSNVTNMGNMFTNCSSLVTVPQFDTSKVTVMGSMFNNCQKLIIVPQFDTSKVTNMNNMFYGCTVLTALPLFDCGNVTDIGMFGYNGAPNMRDLGGFKDLGKKSSVSNTNNNFLNKSPYLTYESAMNVINNLYDRKTAGYSVLTLKFHANVLALLSDDDIAIATNKGWTIS